MKVIFRYDGLAELEAIGYKNLQICKKYKKSLYIRKNVVSLYCQTKTNKDMKVGDRVKTTEVSPYRTEGTIDEVYKIAGYWYYIIKGRAYRAQDLKKVGA